MNCIYIYKGRPILSIGNIIPTVLFYLFFFFLLQSLLNISRNQYLSIVIVVSEDENLKEKILMKVIELEAILSVIKLFDGFKAPMSTKLRAN